MSRTDLDAATLANSLRMMAGDGSIEWVSEPIQASVLLDIADMLDENAKLRDERERLFRANVDKNREVLRLLDENARLKQELESVGTAAYLYGRTDLADENAKLRDERDRMYKANVEKNGEILNLLIEAARRRELIRCLVNAENPSDRAKLIADATDVLAEIGVKVPS